MEGKYRINGFEQIKEFYGMVFNNEFPFKPHHISLYLFLLNQNNRSNWSEWFKCPYDLAMNGACVNSKETYYRCLHELQDWELIEYKPGINNWKAPLVKLKCLTKNGHTDGQVDVPLSEQVDGQAPGQLPEQVVRQVVEQLAGQLPEHIYKLITNNLKQITDNLERVLNFLSIPKPKEKLDFDFIPEYKEILENWFEYKKARRESYKNNKSQQAFYNKLIKISGNNLDISKQIIENSMANNYAGIFPIKKENNQVFQLKKPLT